MNKVTDVSGFTGAYFYGSTQKYIGYLQLDGKYRSLGIFETKDEATAAHKAAVIDYENNRSNVWNS